MHGSPVLIPKAGHGLWVVCRMDVVAINHDGAYMGRLQVLSTTSRAYSHKHDLPQTAEAFPDLVGS